jgi:CHAT domain-containing protein
VYDGTAPQLMRGFFEQLAAGRPVAEAISRTQREFLEERRQEGDE